MIIGHINKLDKKNINKNFIKKRHGLEKKLDCSSFIYSTKNTMFMIFDKKNLMNIIFMKIINLFFILKDH